MPRSPILETSPVTSATHAMQTMVFGQHADFPSPDASSVPSLQGSEKATTPSPAASMQAPRAMHLSSLLSNSADNSPILDPGLKTSQMYTFATPHMPENSSSVLAHQAQFDLASTTSFNPSLCPHQQPHPSQYCYGTPGDTAIYYVPRHDSIVSPSETASAGLMSPMSIFHSPQAFSEGLPSATFSVASHNTVLTSPASSATYSETYARKNSTAASPGLARSEMSYASEQYAFHQVAHSRPFASGAGSSSYFATSPVESIQTSLTRAGAIPGVHSSSSDVFSAPSAARGSQAWHWVSNPGESESKQSIRAEQGDYMHQDS